MSWIDEGLKRQQDAADQKNLIFQHAEIIFNQLWTEIMRCIKEAQGKGMTIFMNGSSFQREVSIPVQPKSSQDYGNPKKLNILLSKDRTAIDVTGFGNNLKFYFEVYDGNVVCLKYDGKHIELADAARIILEPFFFPQTEP